ncbi:MAG: hypothetical protein GX977_01165 [Firmicutes bacterium]|nr:hypothetical protein [Bacillota bacterium]
MGYRQECFQVFPLVVPADQTTTITIRALYDHCRLEKNTEYEVAYYPKEYWTEECKRKTFFLRPQGDSLVISHHFTGEQEHVFTVTYEQDGEEQSVGTFSVYSLQPDLFARRPFKGDLHMHSYYSDGRQSPAYVGAYSRMVGLDFIAITDHHQYAPSLEVQNAFSEVAVDLRMFPGEEVHPPECHTHLVNFGGSFSVNQLFQDRESYRHELEGVMQGLNPLPAGIDPYEYASLVWSLDKIREAKGLGIFCHPHWVTDNRFNVPRPLLDYLFEQQPFDAFELLGGIAPQCNNLQVAYYNEQRAHGRIIPIVGSSDSHSCLNHTRLGAIHTIVFSPTLELQDLISSVKELYSVAVEAIPGENSRVYGPLRLVKYAEFLLRKYVPLHDRMCFAEGNHMLDYIGGNEEAANWLQACKGQVGRLMDKLWA